MSRCPSCGERLPFDRTRGGARCPRCRDPLYESLRAFGQPPGPSDGQCAIHPGSAAVATCPRCGNYLCPICRTRWQEQVVCVACVDRALQSQERLPQEARVHLRQAVLALLCGLGAWVVLVASVVVMVVGAAMVMAGGSEEGGIIIAGLGGLAALSSLLPAALGIGLAAAAIRTRGAHLILATAGLILSALHPGLVLGLICYSLWQN